MYTKQDLIKALEEMGIQKTDTVFVHSSMKAIGDVTGGADTVLDAFMEYLEEGLLVLPAHTWGFINETFNVFDPKKEGTCVGILSNLFLKRKGVYRSLHPTHSVAAYGKDAEKFVTGEENVRTPCAPGGCYDRLRERNAKILLLGVDHSKNTFLHCVEELLDVPERFTEEPVEFFICMPDGNYQDSMVYRHYNKTTAHISEAYPKMEQAFYENGVATQTSFGDATCILCDANGLYHVMQKVLQHNKNCLMEIDAIPCEWWS